jgi:hypothetical protein
MFPFLKQLRAAEAETASYLASLSNPVNFYYDWTADANGKPTLSSDTEGNLVQLCKRCAAPHLADGNVDLASQGDYGSICELCEQENA